MAGRLVQFQGFDHLRLGLGLLEGHGFEFRECGRWKIDAHPWEDGRRRQRGGGGEQERRPPHNGTVIMNVGEQKTAQTTSGDAAATSTSPPHPLAIPINHRAQLSEAPKRPAVPNKTRRYPI